MREVRSEYFVLKPVKKNMTLSDKAYHVLRNAIVCNELVPGDVLTEEKLCAELSISRTPIRAAPFADWWRTDWLRCVAKA